MEYTQLGRTGLKVSRLCLGTMNFGPKTTEEDSFAIMDKAHDLDINFFDAANTYGWLTRQGTGRTARRRRRFERRDGQAGRDLAGTEGRIA
jgi:aryl-alcohol dehydrogenase-like predicted oxidoreductase